MRITPLDIRKQEFKRAVRGFDRDEVSMFLEMVAEEFESLLRENSRLNEETVKLRTQLQDYQEVERTLKHALKNAQDTAQQSMENSRREADMIVREAEMQAERILRDAKVRLADLKNDLLVVRAQKDSFARRLRHLLESQLELIGVLELDDLGFGEPNASPTGSRPAASPQSPNRKSVAQPAGRATTSRRVPASKSTSSDGDKNLPSGATRGQAGRLPLPSRETARASQNRSATDNDDEFHPVADASNFNDGKRRFPKEQTKQETRISDHLIT